MNENPAYLNIKVRGNKAFVYVDDHQLCSMGIVHVAYIIGVLAE